MHVHCRQWMYWSSRHPGVSSGSPGGVTLCSLFTNLQLVPGLSLSLVTSWDLYCIFCFGHSPFSYVRNTGFLFRVKIIAASVGVVLQSCEGAAPQPAVLGLVHVWFDLELCSLPGPHGELLCVCRCSLCLLFTQKRVSVVCPCPLCAVLAAGQPRLARSSSVGQGRDGLQLRGLGRLQGEQESRGPGGSSVRGDVGAGEAPEHTRGKGDGQTELGQ